MVAAHENRRSILAALQQTETGENADEANDYCIILISYAPWEKKLEAGVHLLPEAHTSKVAGHFGV